jgi:hypothetical protein
MYSGFADLPYGDTFQFAVYILLLLPLVYYVTLGSVLGALGVTLLQAGFFVLFHSCFSDQVPLNGFVDQQTYLAGALWASDNFGVFELIKNPSLIAPEVGGHVGYFILVFISFEVFGYYVLSPVLTNILILAFSSIIFRTLVMELKFGPRISRIIVLAYCLHPELFPWAAFFVLRDTMICALIVCFLYALIGLRSGFNLKYFLVLLATLVILWVFRIHLAYILVLSLFPIFGARVFSRWSLLIMVLSVITFGLNQMELIQNMTSQLLLKINLLGPAQMLLSPFPGLNMMGKGYEFLLPAMWFNYFFAIFIPLGIVYLLIRDRSIGLILVVTFFAVLLAIGFYDNVAGPRQRLNLIPQLLIFQIAGFIFARKLLLNSSFWRKGTSLR